VPVALIHGRVSGQAVEITLAFDVIDPDTFGAFNDNI
jgi:hypothetical protein